MCREFSSWLSTINEWEYHCEICDIRFNEAGVVRPEDRRKVFRYYTMKKGTMRVDWPLAMPE